MAKADGVVSLTHNGAKVVKEWMESKRPRLTVDVIPCCVDVELFSRERITDAQHSAMRTELGLSEDDYIVVYLGSVGTVYLLKDMLRLFMYIKEVRPKAKFLFITPNEPNEILGPAATLGISLADIRIRKAIRPEVPVLASLGKVTVMFFKQTFPRKATSPTKLAELLSLEIPVITNTGIGDTDYLIQKYGFGILLSDFSDKSLRAVPSQLDKLESIQGSAIRLTAMEYFHLEKGVEAYWKLYTRILENLPNDATS